MPPEYHKANKTMAETQQRALTRNIRLQQRQLQMKVAETNAPCQQENIHVRHGRINIRKNTF